MNLLLGVTGGIAAYKACELTSLATKAGWSVRVIMTPAATRFVGPLTFEALTNHPVMTHALHTGYSPDGASAVEHISWAKWADVACIAPLSANTLGRIACGLADDALSTVWLALPREVPRVLCPAMNTVMWESAAVQRNLRWIAELGGHQIVEPVSKRLACGDVGPGGLADPNDILAVLNALGNTRRPPGAQGE